MNQKEFDFGLFTKLTRIIVGRDVLLSSFKFKGILPPLAK